MNAWVKDGRERWKSKMEVVRPRTRIPTPSYRSLSLLMMTILTAESPSSGPLFRPVGFSSGWAPNDVNLVKPYSDLIPVLVYNDRQPSAEDCATACPSGVVMGPPKLPFGGPPERSTFASNNASATCLCSIGACCPSHPRYSVVRSSQVSYFRLLLSPCCGFLSLIQV